MAGVFIEKRGAGGAAGTETHRYAEGRQGWWDRPQPRDTEVPVVRKGRKDGPPKAMGGAQLCEAQVGSSGLDIVREWFSAVQGGPGRRDLRVRPQS